MAATQSASCRSMVAGCSAIADAQFAAEQGGGGGAGGGRLKRRGIAHFPPPPPPCAPQPATCRTLTHLAVRRLNTLTKLLCLSLSLGSGVGGGATVAPVAAPAVGAVATAVRSTAAGRLRVRSVPSRVPGGVPQRCAPPVHAELWQRFNAARCRTPAAGRRPPAGQKYAACSFEDMVARAVAGSEEASCRQAKPTTKKHGPAYPGRKPAG